MTIPAPETMQICQLCGAATQTGPAVEAARQAGRLSQAGLGQSPGLGHGTGSSSTYLEPVDGPDLRT